MNMVLYERLIDVARNQETVTYSEIGPLVGIHDWESPHNRKLIGDILGEIFEYEHRAGRPLLTAVVVGRDTNLPGQGFFDYAREIGLFRGNDEVAFFARELNRVHDYWSRMPVS